MKKNLLLLFLTAGLLSGTTLYSKAQQITFTKVIDGIAGPSIAPAFDGGYMITGDNTLVKMDSLGNVLWSRQYSSSAAELTNPIFNAITATNDSCFFIVGEIYNTTTTYLEALCIKVKQNGDELWSKTISHNTHYLQAISVQQTSDSGYVFSGYSQWGVGLYNGIVVAKLDDQGNLEWSTVLNGGNNSHYGYSVKETPGDGYIVTGYYENYPPFDGNAFLLKLSSSGTLEWAKKYNYATPLFCFGNDVLVTPNGYLCYLNTADNVAVMKTDLLGNEVWTAGYGVPGTGSTMPQRSVKIHETSDTSYIFTNGSDYSGGLTKIDTNGTIIWSRQQMLSAMDAFETEDKGFCSIGYGPWIGVQIIPEPGGDPKSALSGLGSQVGIIKSDSLGNAEACVQDQSLNTGNEHMISSDATFTAESGATATSIDMVIQTTNLTVRNGCIDFFGAVNDEPVNKLRVYPNPASSTIVVEFTAGGRHQELKIYSSAGQLVYSGVPEGPKSAIDVSSLCSGIYYISINDGKQRVSATFVKE